MEGTLGKVQEKGGGIVGASCWPAHWPIVGFIFLDYRITIISATSFFHPGPDIIFIDLFKLRQYTILSVLLAMFSRVLFLIHEMIFTHCHVTSSPPKLEIINI